MRVCSARKCACGCESVRVRDARACVCASVRELGTRAAVPRLLLRLAAALLGFDAHQRVGDDRHAPPQRLLRADPLRSCTR